MALRETFAALGCAAAVYAGIASLYYQPRPPIDRDLAVPSQSPMCPALPVMQPAPKAETCNPACKITEVCISGVCCQPAETWRGELIATGIWAADTLR